jgi:hypothetical protein
MTASYLKTAVKPTPETSYILSRVCVTVDGVLDWIMDLLTTLTHAS